MSDLMASAQWPYIWPVYAITVTTFVVLAFYAIVSLRRAAQRARKAEAP